VIDSQELLRGFTNYVPFDSSCGMCGTVCHVTPKTQKYILEMNRVPVSAMLQGAVFCEECRARRARLKVLRRNDRWRQEPNGAAELERLEGEERAVDRGRIGMPSEV
jgi:hypothetical protein